MSSPVRPCVRNNFARPYVVNEQANITIVLTSTAWKVHPWYGDTTLTSGVSFHSLRNTVEIFLSALLAIMSLHLGSVALLG